MVDSPIDALGAQRTICDQIIGGFGDSLFHRKDRTMKYGGTHSQTLEEHRQNDQWKPTVKTKK
jgi:hypothetical protein